MKYKLLLIGTVVVLASTGCSSAGNRRASSNTQTNTAQKNATQTNAATHAARADDGHGHGHSTEAARVPAFEQDPKALPATLKPEMFTGSARQAYKAVGEIPATIARLPCYCHCDRGFGHKSLHSCFVDDHASMCAICVEEALMAHRLEKQDKLTPEQIRERIIEKYSKAQE